MQMAGDIEIGSAIDKALRLRGRGREAGSVGRKLSANNYYFDWRGLWPAAERYE